MKVHYQTVKLSDVIKYFVKDFELESGTTIFSTDFYIDQQKDTVVFKFYIEKKDNKEK